MSVLRGSANEQETGEQTITDPHQVTQEQEHSLSTPTQRQEVHVQYVYDIVHVL